MRAAGPVQDGVSPMRVDELYQATDFETKTQDKKKHRIEPARNSSPLRGAPITGIKHIEIRPQAGFAVVPTIGVRNAKPIQLTSTNIDIALPLFEYGDFALGIDNQTTFDIGP